MRRLDWSDYRTELAKALHREGGGQFGWNCFAIAFRDPPPEVTYPDHSKGVPDLSSYPHRIPQIDGCPNGTILFWCCPTTTDGIPCRAAELHVRNDLPMDYELGSIWLNVPAPAADVIRSPCVFIDWGTQEAVRQSILDAGKRLERREHRWKWLTGLLGISTDNHPNKT